MSIENLIKELADSYALIVKDKNSALRSIECVNSPKPPIVEESKLAVDNVSRNIRHSIEAMFHRYGVYQLDQEVKELKAYIQKLQAERVENVSKERKRWAKEDLKALAQHDKEVTSNFVENLLGQLPNPPRRFWVSDLKLILEQLQQGEG